MRDELFEFNEGIVWWFWFILVCIVVSILTVIVWAGYEWVLGRL